MPRHFAGAPIKSGMTGCGDLIWSPKLKFLKKSDPVADIGNEPITRMGSIMETAPVNPSLAFQQMVFDQVNMAMEMQMVTLKDMAESQAQLADMLQAAGIGQHIDVQA